jgi:acyl carrier protein
MKNELFERLKGFVIRQSCVDDEVITDETRISDDLGVNGDDGVEFMIAYGREFNVDVSKFMAANYFDPEGSRVLSAIVESLHGYNKSKRKPLTVGHLLRGIQAGRLDEEVMSGH